MAASTPTELSRYVQVGTLNIHRLMVGMWQTSSTAWGRYPEPSQMSAEMGRYLAAGFTTFDMADHCRLKVV